MKEVRETALTTIDNPYSPFSQFDDWYSYDTEKGYDCCGYIDRMKTVLKEDTTYLSEESEDSIIDNVIDEIVKVDPTKLFVKVEKTKEKENGKDFKIVLPNSENIL